MKKLALFVAVLALLGAGVAGAEETWQGTIADSMCGAKHSADKHGDKASDHRSCVLKCIERGGQYVFLTDGKVLKLTNQSFAELKTFAGQEVMLTGERKDDSITITKIAALEKK